MLPPNTPTVNFEAATAQLTPGDLFISVTPAGDGETGDGRTWRVVTQHGATNSSGYIEIDNSKSRSDYIRKTALKFSVDADDIHTWLDEEIGQRIVAYNNQDHQETEGVKSELPFTCLMTSAELLALDLQVDYLIDHVLIRGQPGVIGGRSKTLKTSVLVDLVLSLGTRTPFLGKFATQQCRVAYWSGESGAAAIRAKAKAAADVKGIDLEAADVLWSFDLPKLSRADHLLAIADVIQKRNIDVAIIDPLYLSLLDASTAGQASNVFAMGAALQPLSELTASTGCTILLCHHFRKSAGDPDEPAALEELSQAGLAEWSRQWLLLARRSPYQADGRHELWLRAGGSAGHAGLYALDVDEGDPETFESGGRRWDVTVRSVSDARDEARRAADNRKAAQAEERATDDRRKMMEALLRCPAGDTMTGLRTLAGLSNQRAADAVRSLVGEGRAEQCEVKKYQRMETGYRATGR